MSVICNRFTFSIDAHQMTVIEADGVAHQPVTVDSLQIFAGQSLILLRNAHATHIGLRPALLGHRKHSPERRSW